MSRNYKLYSYKNTNIIYTELNAIMKIENNWQSDNF